MCHMFCTHQQDVRGIIVIGQHALQQLKGHTYEASYYIKRPQTQEMKVN